MHTEITIEMYAPKICGFPENGNVGQFIQDLLESDENNCLGIVKVGKIYNLKRKKMSKWFSSMYGRTCIIRSQVHYSVASAISRTIDDKVFFIPCL